MPEETQPSGSEEIISVKAAPWLRGVIGRFAPYVVGGMIGATGTGGVMYDAPTKEEIREIVREAVVAEIGPLRDSIRELQTRQTDTEQRLVAHAERMKIYDKKLATRNR